MVRVEPLGSERGAHVSVHCAGEGQVSIELLHKGAKRSGEQKDEVRSTHEKLSAEGVRGTSAARPLAHCCLRTARQASNAFRRSSRCTCAASRNLLEVAGHGSGQVS